MTISRQVKEVTRAIDRTEKKGAPIGFGGRMALTIFAISLLSTTLMGCEAKRLLPMVYMPDAPKECDAVLDQKVEALPSGKTNAAALSAMMAKDSADRLKEQADSKVCAEFALRTAGTMKDKDKPKVAGEPKVEAATKVPEVKPQKTGAKTPTASSG